MNACIHTFFQYPLQGMECSGTESSKGSMTSLQGLDSDLSIKAASIQFSCQKHSLSWLCIYCYESLFQNPEGNLSVRDNFAIWSHVDLIGWLSLMEWFIHHSRCCEWYHLPLDWRDNWHGWVSIENLSEAWTWSARCLMIESESEWPTILRSQEMAHATTIQSVLLRAFKAFTRQKS